VFLINDILTDINSEKRISKINYIMCIKNLLNYYNINTEYFKHKNHSVELLLELSKENQEVVFMEKLLKSKVDITLKFNTILKMIIEEIKNYNVKYVYCRSVDLDEFLANYLNLQIYEEEQNNEKQEIEINVDNYNMNSIKELKFNNNIEYKIIGNNQYYAEYIRNIMKENTINFYSTVDKENIKYWFDKEFDYDLISRIDLIFEKLSFETKNKEINLLEISKQLTNYQYLAEVLEDKNEEKIILILNDILDKLKQRDLNFDKYFSVFLRLFYLSYNIEMYDVGIKCINEFIEFYGEKFIFKYKKFILKHFINIYEFMNKNQSIYENLFLQYSSICHKEDISYNDSDFINWFNIHEFSEEIFNFKPIFHENEIRCPVSIDLTAINYLENKDSKFEINSINLNTKWLGITKILFSYVRIMVNHYKWKTNNFYIEYILEKTQNEINKIINLDPSLHKHAGQRFSSIVSSKNIIKARYELDNQKYGMKNIADEYNKEIMFIIDRDYHIANTGTYTKCIQSIGEIQSIYNMLEFFNRKTIYSVYLRQVKRFFSSIYNTDYYKKNIFSLETKEDLVSITLSTEVSIIVHYSSVFKSSKSLKTNKSKNVQIELYNLINTFDEFRRHGKLEEEKLEIHNMYDQDFIQVY